MNTAVTFPENNISQLDALWTLFMTQPKAVRKAFVERLGNIDEKWFSSALRRCTKAPSNEITPELQLEIDRVMHEHERGETLRFENKKDMHAWLESL